MKRRFADESLKQLYSTQNCAENIYLRRDTGIELGLRVLHHSVKCLEEFEDCEMT